MRDDDRQALFDAYLNVLRTQRKLSPHTVDAYRRDLSDLARLADNTAPIDVTHTQIRQFAARLHAAGIGPRSIARKLSAWRSFYAWLSQQQPLAVNPVDGVKSPKRTRPLPKALSQDDAIRLVSAALPAAGAADAEAALLCDRAMFELLYSSGLRVSELAGLDWRPIQSPGHTSAGWLDAEAGDVIVTGKGNKRRNVPVGSHALAALRDWLATREALTPEAQGSDSHALFLSRRGTRLTPRAIQLRLKALARRIGLPVNVHPHVLRHSFASHVLQSSGDLRAVQEMLGHRSISSTQVYTSLDFQRLAQVYDAAHPRARKKTDPEPGS